MPLKEYYASRYYRVHVAMIVAWDITTLVDCFWLRGVAACRWWQSSRATQLSPAVQLSQYNLCGGVCVVVFLWWCSCGGVLVAVFVWWCLCGGVFVAVFVWRCLCGGDVQQTPTLFESSEQRFNQSRLSSEPFYRHIFVDLYILYFFETSGTASCGTTGSYSLYKVRSWIPALEVGESRENPTEYGCL